MHTRTIRSAVAGTARRQRAAPAEITHTRSIVNDYRSLMAHRAKNEVHTLLQWSEAECGDETVIDRTEIRSSTMSIPE